MIVYRIRHKETGEYFCNGRSSIFTTKGAAKGSWTQWARCWFAPPANVQGKKFDEQDTYEIVPFKLVEV